MALLPIPDDFGQGGANIGDGEVRLVDILRNHHDEIASVEAGSVDSTARAAAAAASASAALRPLTTDLASTAHGKGASTIGVEAGATNVELKLASLTTAASAASSAAAAAQSTADAALVAATPSLTSHTLTDADASITAAQGSEHKLGAATLTADRTITIDPTGMDTDEVLRIVRTDVTAHQLIVVNGGPGAGTLYTFPVSVKKIAAFKFDGTDVVLSGVARLA